MAPRLNKRQQRELEEISALAGPPREDSNVNDEDDGVSLKNNAAGFSALFTPDESGEETPEEEASKTSKSRKPKKKKKKAQEESMVLRDNVANASVHTPPKQSHATPVQPRNEKKAMKKAKAKEKKAAKDEFDAAFSELSAKYPELQNISSPTPAASRVSTKASISLASLLSVSLAHLDSEAEMRKFFGSKVVAANKSSSAGSAGTSSRRKPGAQRSNLTRPQQSWLATKQREGLSIRVLTQDELEKKCVRQTWELIADEKWWSVEYSKKYKSMTMAFFRTVMSGDPEGFWGLISRFPWHADTLLQLSEVYRHREEYAQAFEFVERALFTYERSFIGAFTFTSGTNRLDFDQVENRPFYLGIHRQVTDLQRRGCVRTAFEFARLLYSLDPWTDPHGALLHLEFLAIKSGMSQWLLDSFEHFSHWRDRGEHYQNRLDPSLLPGWAYARALASRMREEEANNSTHEESTAALKEAILSFPMVVPLLADKLDLTLPTAVTQNSMFRIETDAGSGKSSDHILSLLSHLYARRCAPLWKETAYSAWFASVIDSFAPSLPTNSLANDRRRRSLELFTLPSLRHSVYRHLVVLDASYRSLFSFIPSHVLSAKSFACDPVPPPTSLSEYSEDYFQGTEDMFSMRARTRQERAADERLLERLIPDVHFRRQLQAFFEANPDWGQRFPGGVAQFVQQIPPDVLQDMMDAQVAAGEQPHEHGGMPGQMPGEMLLFAQDDEEVPFQVAEPVRLDEEAPGFRENERNSDDEEYESDEGEDDAPIMPVRILRNFSNWLWRGNQAEELSSDESDAAGLGGDVD